MGVPPWCGSPPQGLASCSGEGPRPRQTCSPRPSEPALDPLAALSLLPATPESKPSCCSQRLQPRPQQQALQPHLHPVPSGHRGAGVLPAAQCSFTPSSPCCVSHRPLEGPGRGDTADRLPHPLPHLLLGLGTPRSTSAHRTGLPPAWSTKGLASREGCVTRVLPTAGSFRKPVFPAPHLKEGSGHLSPHRHQSLVEGCLLLALPAASPRDPRAERGRGWHLGETAVEGVKAGHCQCPQGGSWDDQC